MGGSDQYNVGRGGRGDQNGEREGKESRYSENLVRTTF